METSSWTERRVELLKEMWKEGASAGEIASAIGISRNAVMGKIDRLKLPKKGGGQYRAIAAGRLTGKGRQPGRVKRGQNAFSIPAKAVHGDFGTTRRAQPKVAALIDRAEQHKAAIAAPMLTAIVDDIPPAQRKTLIQLTERTCKWPIGDPHDPGFHFCGASKSPDVKSPYCDLHQQRAYNRFL